MKNSSLLIHTDELTVKWIDRMAEAGVKTLALHPVGGKIAHESLADLVDKCKTDEYRSLLDYASERGLKIEYEMHSMRYLLPESEFEAHPTWFRMNDDGERVTDYNLCATNEEALEYVAERASELVKMLYRSEKRYYLWLDDGKNSYCRCDKCRVYSASDLQLMVLNKIEDRLKQDDKDARLAYLAYYDTIACPTKIKPTEGIFLEYAPFARDFHKPLIEDAEASYLEGLLAFFGKDGAKALDYWYDNSLYSRWKKPPVAFTVDREVLSADIEFYSSLGFEDVASFACYLGDDYEELHGKVDISDFAEAIK